MKKHTIIFLSACMISLVPTSFIFAQAKTPGEAIRKKGEEIRAEIANIRTKIQYVASSTRAELDTQTEGMRTQIEKKKSEVETSIIEHQNKIIQALVDKTTERLSIAEERLDTLAKRMDSRISKMNAEKIDTTDATNSLNLAKSQIAEIHTKIEEIKNNALFIDPTEETSTTTPMTDDEKIKSLKNQATIITNALKTAQETLNQVLADIKNAAPLLKK